MSDLRELYQELILDHYKRPRNFGPLESATRMAEGYNPLCGDKVKIHLQLTGDRVTDIRFEGVGCAISTATASLMTESIKGKTEAEARALFRDFHNLLVGDPSSEPNPKKLGKLAVLAGVRGFPTRVKCATLAWHTLSAALENDDSTVTTE